MTSRECLKMFLFIFFKTCYVHCVNVLKDYFSVWTSGVSLINLQRNANPGGSINKAIFPRLPRATIPSSLIKRKIQQSVNFEKERLKTKINASPSLLLRCYLLFVLKLAPIMFRYIVYILTFIPFLFYTTNLFIRCHQHMQNRSVRLVLKEVLYYPSFALWQSRKLSVNRVWVFVFDSLP